MAMGIGAASTSAGAQTVIGDIAVGDVIHQAINYVFGSGTATDITANVTINATNALTTSVSVANTSTIIVLYSKA